MNTGAKILLTVLLGYFVLMPLIIIKGVNDIEKSGVEIQESK